MRRVGIRCYLNGHDIWVGVYWKRSEFFNVTTIYICPFFCFVIEVTILGKEEKL
jgi:hypothetical protein